MRAIDLRTSLVVGLCACTLASCVNAREADSQGKASFISGAPSASTDYQTAFGGAGGVAATAGFGGIGGVGGTIPLPTAGTVADPIAGAGSESGAMGGAAGMIAGAGGAAGMFDGAGGVAGTIAGASGAGGASGIEPAGGAGGGGAGSTGTTSAGSLAIAFTSAGNAGEYAPRNIGAVWIETSSGTFVKTVARWAGVRAGHLTRWTQASGGWGGGFFFATGGNSADQMDAVTSATLRTHQAHSVTWNMHDVSGMLVPDGAYRVVIEVTESERKASVSAEIAFDKGAAPVSLSPPDQGPYKGLSVTYTP